MAVRSFSSSLIGFRGTGFCLCQACVTLAIQQPGSHARLTDCSDGTNGAPSNVCGQLSEQMASSKRLLRTCETACVTTCFRSFCLWGASPGVQSKISNKNGRPTDAFFSSGSACRISIDAPTVNGTTDVLSYGMYYNILLFCCGQAHKTYQERLVRADHGLHAVAPYEIATYY